MGYNKFSALIVIRIVLIVINLMAVVWSYERSDLQYSLLALIGIVSLQVYGLIHFVNKTNRELSKFIMALRDEDYSTQFVSPPNQSFALLFDRFQNTLASYQSKERKYEAQLLFIQQVIDHIETGIMVWDNQKKIKLCNKTALKYRNEYLFEKEQTLVDAIGTMVSSDLLEGKSQTSENIKLLVNRSSFLLLNHENTIFTFKDISTPLEHKEIDSWQKLIRILAHEIINSLTPITSLTDTNLMIIKKMDQSEELDMLQLSLTTIKERSENLLNFMEDYRRLIKIPTPALANVDLSVVQSAIFTLFTAELKDTEIVVQNDIDLLLADRILLEQMLVNLVTNSIQAMEGTENKKIEWRASIHEDWHQIEIIDNGCGMDAETLDRIFVPFYTTKAEGSGIGLSLVQQIMKLHDGRVLVDSTLEETTRVRLMFRKGESF